MGLYLRHSIWDSSGKRKIVSNISLSSSPAKQIFLTYLLGKGKLLVISVYRPSLQNKYFLHILTKNIDFFADKYHNHLIMGKLNVAPSDHLLIEQFKLNLRPIYVLKVKALA